MDYLINLLLLVSLIVLLYDKRELTYLRMGRLEHFSKWVRVKLYGFCPKCDSSNPDIYCEVCENDKAPFSKENREKYWNSWKRYNRLEKRKQLIMDTEKLYNKYREVYVNSKFNLQVVKELYPKVKNIEGKFENFRYFVEDNHSDYTTYVKINKLEDILENFNKFI